MLHFFKKTTHNTCRYYYQNLDDLQFLSSWDIEQNKLNSVILGHFLPFIPLKTSKIKILREEKICWRYHHFIMCSKNLIIWYLVPEIRSKTDEIFCHFGPLFVFLPPPNNCEYWNFEKNEKNAWRFYPFIHICVL